MRQSSACRHPSPAGGFQGGSAYEKKTMEAERINALGTLIDDLRARTDALRGYL